MRTLTTTVAIAAALILLAYNPQTAQANELRQAWGEAYNLLTRSPDTVDETVDAIQRLEGLLDHDRAVELLEYFDECDMAWDAAMGERDVPKGAKDRPKEAYKIANAILKAVRTMRDAEEVAKFEKQINDSDKYAMRARMAMMDAVGEHAGDNEDCLELLKTVAKNEDGKQDTDMRILAIHYLGDHAREMSVFSIISQTIRDGSWRIRDVSIEAMVRAADHHEDQAVLALINALANEQGKLRKTIADALKDVTGADNGTDPDAWSDWFKARKRDEQGLPPRKGEGRGTRVRVFETDSFSDRYVFLVDTSISMTERITPEEKERLKKSITNEPGEEKDPRRPLDWSKINNKLDLAREELIRSLEVMDPERTMFTVITFAQSVDVWKEELVPTDKRNIDAVAKYLRAIKGQKKTNVFGAIDAAYDLSEELAGVDTSKRKKKRRKKNDDRVFTGEHPDDAIPDTIYIYTDGYATFGKYAGDDAGWQGKSPREKATLYSGIMKEMITEVEDRNRIARITLNCIGVGSPQDSHTMRALAKAGKGEYVAIGK